MALTPVRMPADEWWTYAILFFADYWFHRIHHEVRVFWASHVVHHSSQHYNIRTFRPTKVAFHEFAAIARDVRGATSWRHRLGYLFRGPGWSPDGRGGGTRG